MPVLINKDSGSAEDFSSADLAHQALASGSHEVPLVSPDGDFGSASFADAQQLVQKGYSQPTPEHLNTLLKQAKYGSTSQQLIGAAEQVGKGALGPLSTAGELAFDVNPEDIRGRDESKGAVEKTIEQGVGLLGSEFIPGGQARILGRIGKAATEAAGIGKAFQIGKSASTLTKIGSAAAQAAVENAVYQAGDEASKVILNDPNQTAGSAMTNVGLAAVLGGGVGGAIGSVHPIWSATVGPRVENMLRSIANRANGETLPISENLKSVIDNIEKSRGEVPPAIKSGLSEDPTASIHFQELKESGTTTGDALRQTVDEFKDQVKDQLAGVFKSGEPMTSFEAGEKAKDAILSKANELNQSISEKYADVMPHLDAIQVPDNARLRFYDNIIKTGQEFGSAGSPAEGLFKTYGERVLAQDSISQLKKLNTEIRSEWEVARRSGDFEKARAFSTLKEMINNFQDQQIIQAGKRLGKEGIPGIGEMRGADLGEKLVKDKKAADAMYSDYLGKVGEVASAGRLGKVKSHGQLLDALEKVPSAKLAEKLFDPKNVESLRYLQKEFPGVLDPIIAAKKSSMLEAASSKGELMHNQLLNAVNRIPREAQSMLFTPEELNTIKTSGQILRESTKRMNPSGTAGTLDKLMSHMPGSVGGVAAVLFGHSAIAGAILGQAAKFLGRDAPDAAKMAFLKFLGSSERLDGAGWKASADYIHAALKGETLIQKASKAAVKAGEVVIPHSMVPDEKSRQKLDKRLKQIQQNPDEMLKNNSKIGHYMPDHAQSLAGISMNAVNYLNAIRPKPVRISPLDTEIEPSKQQMSDYNRALDIAEQPMVVLQSIQDGTITHKDISHLTAMYPSVYQRVQHSLMDSVMKQGSDIAYKQRIGLSLFMGQALDSTMTGQAIIAAQPQAPAPMSQLPTKGPHSMKNINKMAQGQATSTQMREMQRAGMVKS